ncbi:MAG: polysaccharide biosynthesis protein [Clostridiales bacterium]|nr:polysaccharide biosynthesis protein [Clostridiales bacterium]
MNNRRNGVVLGYIDTFLKVLIGIVYIPLLLTFISTSDFGVYQLIGSFMSYLMILDFGLANALTKFIAQSNLVKAQHTQDSVISSGFVIYIFMSILVAITGILMIASFDRIFGNQFSIEEIKVAREMLVIVVISSIAIISTNILTSILTAYEKFVFLKVMSILQTVLQPIVIIALLSKWSNIYFIVLIQLCFILILIFLKAMYVSFVMKIKITFKRIDTKLIKTILTFSSFIFLNLIIDQIYWKSDNFILAAINGPKIVAEYSIATQIILYYMILGATISSVFLPKVSQIVAKKNFLNELNLLFKKVSRLQFFILSLILSGFIVFGKEFIIFWVGIDFNDVYYYIIILMFSIIIPLSETIGISILQALNKHKFRSVVYFIIAILNVIFTIPFAKEYGGYGAAACTGIAQILGNVIIINIYYQKNGIDVIGYFRSLKVIIILTVICTMMGIFVKQWLNLNNPIVFLISIVLYTFLFILLNYKFNFNVEEKEILRLNKIRKRRI